MRVKILAFADFPSPYRVEVFKGLAKEYDMLVVFDKMSDQNRNAAWFCKDTGLNSISLLEESGRIQFEKELKQIKKYDLVLAYDYHIKNAIRLELACIKNKVPYIMNLDGAFIRKNFIKNIIKRYLVTHAAGYFASGNHAAEYFKYFGADENKIYYHPFTSLHADEILKEPLSETEKAKYKKKLGVDKPKMVLTIGQFIHRKGFDVLLKAWNKELDENCSLVIVGGGEEENQYQQYIADHNLKNVQLVGFKQKEEIFEYVQKQYGTLPEYLWSKLPDSAVLRHKNGKWYAVIMTVEKSKLGLEGRELVDIIDVKCDPDMTNMIIQTYGFLPGYHMNKQHWITILLDGSVSEAKVLDFLDMSYDLIDGAGGKEENVSGLQ